MTSSFAEDSGSTSGTQRWPFYYCNLVYLSPSILTRSRIQTSQATFAGSLLIRTGAVNQIRERC